MGDRLTYERFLWFHSKVKSGRYPNATQLAGQFEISPRTAQRAVDFIRDRLKAPLQYSNEKKGYYYTDDTYELPSSWISEDTIIALALAVRLASSIPDAGIKQNLLRLIDQISGGRSDHNLTPNALADKISVKNIEYSRVDERVFHEIVSALFDQKPLSITYYSPHTGKETSRTILPLHLIHYMGSWHIIAYCASKKELRDFALSRVRAVASSEVEISLPDNLPSIREHLRKNFGIMQGEESTEVMLKFSAKVAAWVGEQVWHPRQEATSGEDGSLTLTFPAADLREVKRRILSYGAEVVVVEPWELREEVRKEIANMSRVYGRYDTD
ncbi:MAG: WYL domain-containing protein [Thermodesulfovibrionales bacterium]|jgi:predicted DNA-binding transcriptional regulator YafY